ncbi:MULTISPECIES: hypothetical protein [Streptomyces]|uniref:hypothetical protein n=1 Tax=Streptomyces TaxID=1883 RepID=UPI0036500A46
MAAATGDWERERERRVTAPRAAGAEYRSHGPQPSGVALRVHEVHWPESLPGAGW